MTKNLLVFGLILFETLAQAQKGCDGAFEPGRVVPLSALSRDQLSEIQPLARRISEEGIVQGRITLFDFSAHFVDFLAIADRQTSFSQVYLDKEGKVGGFALARIDGLTKRVHVDKLAVARDYRKNGVASQLLAEVARRAQKIKKKELELFVLTDNNPAIGLYRKLGFVDISDKEPPMTLNPSFRMVVAPATLLAHLNGN